MTSSDLALVDAKDRQRLCNASMPLLCPCGCDVSVHGAQPMPDTMPGWGENGGPVVAALARRVGMEPGEFGRVHWLDHRYRRVFFEDGALVTEYISEPMDLDGDAFNDFVWLEQQGWRVLVEDGTLHFPGDGVSVNICWLGD